MSTDESDEDFNLIESLYEGTCKSTGFDGSVQAKAMFFAGAQAALMALDEVVNGKCQHLCCPDEALQSLLEDCTRYFDGVLRELKAAKGDAERRQ